MLSCSCLDHLFLLVYNSAHFHWVYVTLHPLVTGFFKFFVHFTLHLFSHVCLFFPLFDGPAVPSLCVPRYPSMSPAPTHHLLCLRASPQRISADRLSILSSFTFPCCFDPGAVLICHVASNSHLCILLYIFHSLQPSSPVFRLKIQPLIASLSTILSFVTKNLLDQFVMVIYLFLVKITDIYDIAGIRNYPCVDCLDKVPFIEFRSC